MKKIILIIIFLVLLVCFSLNGFSQIRKSVLDLTSKLIDLNIPSKFRTVTNGIYTLSYNNGVEDIVLYFDKDFTNESGEIICYGYEKLTQNSDILLSYKDKFDSLYAKIDDYNWYDKEKKLYYRLARKKDDIYTYAIICIASEYDDEQ